MLIEIRRNIILCGLRSADALALRLGVLHAAAGRMDAVVEVGSCHGGGVVRDVCGLAVLAAWRQRVACLSWPNTPRRTWHVGEEDS